MQPVVSAGSPPMTVELATPHQTSGVWRLTVRGGRRFRFGNQRHRWATSLGGEERAAATRRCSRAAGARVASEVSASGAAVDGGELVDVAGVPGGPGVGSHVDGLVAPLFMPVDGHGVFPPAGSGMASGSPFRRRGTAARAATAARCCGSSGPRTASRRAVVGDLERLVQALLGGLVVPRVAERLPDQLSQDSWMSSRSSAYSVLRVRMPGRTALSATIDDRPSWCELHAEAGRDGSTTVRSGVTPCRLVVGDRHGGQPLPDLAGVLRVGQLPPLACGVPAPVPGDVQPPVDAQAQDDGVERVPGAVVDAHRDPAGDRGQIGDDVPVLVEHVEDRALGRHPQALDVPLEEQADVLALQRGDEVRRSGAGCRRG
jgi:hypothetical protein